MRVLILGGDGYLGWPTAMRFSGQGHDVAVVDSFARRRWVEEAGSHSLTPIASLDERIQAWSEVSGKDIEAYIGDIAEGTFVTDVVREFEPEAIIHYGEQPSAPWSMKSVDHAVMTQANNVIGTLKLSGRCETTPRTPPDQARDDGRVRHAQHRHRRGLHRDRPQGPEGHASLPQAARVASITSRRCTTATTSSSAAGSGGFARPTSIRASFTARDAETRLDERLITRFDYDALFGTVLNRFIVQAVIGHPLTVYGDGGQTRGFLNIVDTLQCVALAAEQPGRPRRVPRLQPVHRGFQRRRPRGESPPRGRRARHRGAGRSRGQPAPRARGALLQPGAHEAPRARAAADTPFRDAHRVHARGHQASQGPRPCRRHRPRDPVASRTAGTARE